MTLDVEALLHGVTMDTVLEHKYDPVYARQYYLRTRQLKGRTRREGYTNDKDEFKEHATGNEGKYDRPGDKDKKTPKERREELEARKARLKAKIDKLEAVLAELVKAAKARSGVETKEPKASATKTSTTKETSSKSEKKSDDKPATVSEKKEAAKRAREHYEKTKPKGKSPAQEVQALENKVQDLRQRITKVTEDARRKRESQSKNDQTASKGR